MGFTFTISSDREALWTSADLKKVIGEQRDGNWGRRDTRQCDSLDGQAVMVDGEGGADKGRRTLPFSPRYTRLSACCHLVSTRSEQPVTMTSDVSGQFMPKDGPEIRTARLVIRPVRESDTAAIFAMRSNQDIMRWRFVTLPFLCMTPRLTITGVNSTFKKAETDICQTIDNLKKCSSPTSLLLVVSEADDPAAHVCGTVGFWYAPENRVEMGYMLLPSVWGKGYATEAARASLAAWWDGYAGVKDGIPEDAAGRVWAVTHRGNSGSYGVLRKCGFDMVEEMEDKYGPGEVWRLDGPKAPSGSS